MTKESREGGALVSCWWNRGGPPWLVFPGFLSKVSPLRAGPCLHHWSLFQGCYAAGLWASTMEVFSTQLTAPCPHMGPRNNRQWKQVYTHSLSEEVGLSDPIPVTQWRVRPWQNTAASPISSCLGDLPHKAKTTESGSHCEPVLGGVKSSPVPSGLPKLPQAF